MKRAHDLRAPGARRRADGGETAATARHAESHLPDGSASVSGSVSPSAGPGDPSPHDQSGQAPNDADRAYDAPVPTAILDYARRRAASMSASVPAGPPSSKTPSIA